MFFPETKRMIYCKNHVNNTNNIELLNAGISNDIVWDKTRKRVLSDFYNMLGLILYSFCTADCTLMVEYNWMTKAFIDRNIFVSPSKLFYTSSGPLGLIPTDSCSVYGTGRIHCKHTLSVNYQRAINRVENEPHYFVATQTSSAICAQLCSNRCTFLCL